MAPAPTTAAPRRTGPTRRRRRRESATPLLDPVHRVAGALARRRLAPGPHRTWTPRKRDRLTGAVDQPVCAKEKGHHLALAVAHRPLVDVFGLGAIGRIALDIDALDPAAIDEVVDVASAPGGRERAVDVGGLRPSAEIRSWFMSTLRSTRPAVRTGGPAAGSGSAVAICSSRSRASSNCSCGMPLVFWSCMLKPPDWPRPRIAAGSARTPGHRDSRGRPPRRVGLSRPHYSRLPCRSSNRREVDERLAGILARSRPDRRRRR